MSRVALRSRPARGLACAIFFCAVGPAGGCTTRETGSIDLAIASAAPKPMAAPKPPKMPPPPPSCASDMDCAMAKPHCNTTTETCTECVADVDCADPKRPFCQRDAGKCSECTTDTDCPPEATCARDFTCKPR